MHMHMPFNMPADTIVAPMWPNAYQKSTHSCWVSTLTSFFHAQVANMSLSVSACDCLHAREGRILAPASTEAVGPPNPTGGRERIWKCWVVRLLTMQTIS